VRSYLSERGTKPEEGNHQEGGVYLYTFYCHYNVDRSTIDRSNYIDICKTKYDAVRLSLRRYDIITLTIQTRNGWNIYEVHVVNMMYRRMVLHMLLTISYRWLLNGHSERIW
jgi:hypothetical protein